MSIQFNINKINNNTDGLWWNKIEIKNVYTQWKINK